MKKKLTATLATAGITSALVGTSVGLAAYYLLKNDNIYKTFYDHNFDGDLVLKFRLVQEKKGEYFDSKAIAIFKDKTGKSYEVEFDIDEKGFASIDTKTLPNNQVYNLNRIVDAKNKKEVIFSNEELIKELKEDIIKPTSIVRIFEQDKEMLVAQLDKSTIFDNLSGIFINSKGQRFEIKSLVNKNAQITFDTTPLPEGEVYVLETIARIEPDNKLHRVANLNDVLWSRKIVNKLDIVNHDFNLEGDLVLRLKATHKNLEQNQIVKAVFKSASGDEFFVNGSIDQTGVLSFDTETLQPTTIYQLDRIIDSVNGDKVIFKNKELSDSLKEPFAVPFISNFEINSFDNAGNNAIFKFKTFTEFIGKTILATFADENGNKIELSSRYSNDKGEFGFDLDGIFEGTKKLEPSHIYCLTDLRIKDLDGKKVVNFEHKPKEELRFNRLNHDSLNDNKALNTHNAKGDLLLNVKVESKYANEQAYAIFKDANNNEYKVVAEIDKEGNVKFDTTTLPNNGVYTLDKVVSVNDESDVLVKNYELSLNQRTPFTKPGVKIQNNTSSLSMTFQEPGLKDKAIKVTFKDTKGNRIVLDGKIDQNGNATINTDDTNLAVGEVYVIDSITNTKNPTEKLINLNNVALADKVIDKYQTPSEKDPFNWDINNNLIISLENIDVSNQTPNSDGFIEALAVFVDETGEKHNVPILIDKNGKVVISTADLANDHTYELKTLSTKDGQSTIANETSLGKATRPFKKPFFKAEVDNNNDTLIDFRNNIVLTNLINKEVEATFVDEKGQKFKGKGIVGAEGKVLFNTGNNETFPKGKVYKLINVVKTDDNKVLVQNHDLKVNKKQVGTKTTNDEGGETVKLPSLVVEPSQIKVVLRDQDGKLYEVAVTNAGDGQVSFDSDKDPLTKDKIYDIVKVVQELDSANEDVIPFKTIFNEDDLNPEVTKLNNTKEMGRKITVKKVLSNFLQPNYARIELDLEDINHLVGEKQLALTIQNTKNKNKTHKWVAKIDPETKRISFDFANLDNSQEYRVIGFDFEPSDDSIKFIKNDLENFTFTTLGVNDSRASWGLVGKIVNGKLEQEIQSTKNSAKIQIAILNNTDSKPLKVKFVEINENGSFGVETEKDLNLEGEIYVASIDGLKANTQYLVTNVVYTDGSGELFIVKDRNLNRKFGTTGNSAQLTFNEMDLDNRIGYFDAKLTLNYTDPDKKLEIGTPLLVKIQKFDDPLSPIQEAIGYVTSSDEVTSKGKITLEVRNLKSGQYYVFKEVTSLSKSPNAKEKTILEFVDKNNSFQMLSPELINQLIEIKLDKSEYQKTDIIKIEAKFGRSRRQDVKDKYVKLVYVNEFDPNNQVEVAAPVQFTEDRKNPLSFTIPADRVKGNARYVFSKVLIGDNATNVIENFKVIEFFSNSFTVLPTTDVTLDTNVAVSLVKNASNENEVHIELNDPDAIFDNNTQFEVTIAPADDLNNTITAVALVGDKNPVETNKKLLKVPVDKFASLNKKYIIKKVEMVNKLAKIVYPLANNHTDNVIYDSSKPNTTELSFIKDVKISNITIAEEAKQQGEKPKAKVTFELTNKTINLKDKYFRLTVKVNNANANPLPSTSYTIDEATNNIVFDLKDLPSNREYKVEKLTVVDYATDFDTDKEVEMPKDSSMAADAEYKVVIEPGASTVELSPETTTELDTANVKLLISSEDGVDFTQTRVKVTLVKASDNTVIETKENLTPIKEKDNFFVEVPFTGLNSNTEYKISKVELSAKPNETKQNIGTAKDNQFTINPEIKFTTLKGTITLVSDITSTVDETANTVTVKLTLNVKGSEFTRQKVKLTYQDKDNAEATSNAQDLQLNENEYTFTISNPDKKDITYSLSKIEYGTDGSITTPLETNGKHDEFVMPSQPVTFTFDKTDAEQVIGETTATLIVKFEDTNTETVIKDNSEITLRYRPKVEGSNSIQTKLVVAKTVSATDKKATFELTKLAPETTYELVDILIKKADDKDEAPKTRFKNNNKEFTTLEIRPNEVKSFTPNVIQASGTEKAKATIQFSLISDRAKTWASKDFRATFTTTNPGEAVEFVSNSQQMSVTDEATGVANISNLEVTNLLNNREYKLARLEIQVNGVWEEVTLPELNTTFTTAPGTSSAQIIGGEVNNVWDTKAKFEINITDADQAIEEGQEVSAIIVTTDGQNTEFNATGVVVINEDDEKTASFEFAGLTSNTEYKVKEIKLVTKPELAKVNLNTNGVLYPESTSPEIKFTTSKEFKVVSAVASLNDKNVKFDVVIQGRPATEDYDQVIVEFKQIDNNQLFYAIQKDTLDYNFFEFNSTADSTVSFEVKFNKLMANREYVVNRVLFYDSSRGEFDGSTQLDESKVLEVMFVDTATEKSKVVTKPSKTTVTKGLINKVRSNGAFMRLNLVDYLEDNGRKFAHRNDYQKLTFAEDQKVSVTISYDNNGTTETIVKENIALKASATQPSANKRTEDVFWVIEHDWTELKPGIKYTVTSVKFMEKPAKAHTNLNSDNDNVIYSSTNATNKITFSTIGDTPILNRLDIINPDADGKPASINAIFDINNAILENQKLRLVYKDNNNVEVKSQVVTGESDTINSLTFTFDSTTLEFNKKYTFERLEFAATEDELENVATRKEFTSNVDSDFVVRNRPITISSTKENSFVAWTDAGKASLKLVLNDQDNVLQGNENVIIAYAPLNGGVSGTIQATVASENNEKFVKFELPVEKFNVEYEIQAVRLDAKPANAQSSVGIENKDETIYDKTVNDQGFKYQALLEANSLLDISEAGEWDKDEPTVKVKLTLNIENGFNISNKTFQLELTNGTDTFKSAENPTVNNDDKTVEFTLTKDTNDAKSLSSNFKYTVKSLKIKENDAAKTFDNDSQDVKFAQGVNKVVYTKASSTVVEEFTTTQPNNAVKVTTKLISKDEIFKNNQAIKFTFGAKASDDSALANVEYTFTLSGITNAKEANISFDLDNLVDGGKYELIKVQFVNRPVETLNTLHYNVNEVELNSNADNIIFDKENAQFSNKSKVDAAGLTFTKSIDQTIVPVIKANTAIEWLNTTNEYVKEEDKQLSGADLIGKARKFHSSISNIGINSKLVNIQDVKVELTGTANIWQPATDSTASGTTNTKPAEAHVLEFIAKEYNDGKILFDVEGLKPGYTYKFTKLTIKQKRYESDATATKEFVFIPGQTQDATEFKLENAPTDFDSYTARSWGIDQLEFDKDKSVFPDFDENSFLVTALSPDSTVQKSRNVILAFKNGWEISDFAKLFNYLRNEAPDGEDRNDWIARLRNIIKTFFKDKTFNTTLNNLQNSLPSKNDFESVQLGTKWSSTETDKIKVYNFDESYPIDGTRTTSVDKVLNPILGGFNADYDSTSGDLMHLISGKNRIKDVKRIDEFIDFILNRPVEYTFKTTK